jgi:hypothetical protein
MDALIRLTSESFYRAGLAWLLLADAALRTADAITELGELARTDRAATR